MCHCISVEVAGQVVASPVAVAAEHAEAPLLESLSAPDRHVGMPRGIVAYGSSRGCRLVSWQCRDTEEDARPMHRLRQDRIETLRGLARARLVCRIRSHHSGAARGVLGTLEAPSDPPLAVSIPVRVPSRSPACRALCSDVACPVDALKARASRPLATPFGCERPRIECRLLTGHQLREQACGAGCALEPRHLVTDRQPEISVLG